MAFDPKSAKSTLETSAGTKTIYKLNALKAVSGERLAQMPYSIRVLAEALLRNFDNYIYTPEHLEAIARYDAKAVGEVEIPFMPGRVVLQDFTGVPCVVDLAAMRAAAVRLGADPKKVNPMVPCDLVIDHSIVVEDYAKATSLTVNGEIEFQRNQERYKFLKWGQSSFNNFRVVPPATGIVHQVNLEYLAKVVWETEGVLYPDTCVGTDSHTTMINGLGVVGWGVGGIEAEAVMLGQPTFMLIPEVVGMKLTGKLKEGVTATDLVLRITEMLRKHGVVSKFVEFFGPGLASMPLANRATIANMAPEYGATIGFFPIDEQTLTYMRLSGRDEAQVKVVETYAKANMLWRTDADEAKIEYAAVLELDLGTVQTALAGPKRPQDRVNLSDMQKVWQDNLGKTFNKHKVRANGVSTPASLESEGGLAVDTEVDPGFDGVDVELDGSKFKLKHGAVCIAAITSCTNTSNPEVMLAAGLVAKKAAALGLTRKPWVKTSLAPGSKVVTEYYNAAGVSDALNAIGFYTVGYGCTTCIGNSGPLPEPVSKAINANDLICASVLSGNRNFEGRVSGDLKANYLASPPLVVVYALAGTVNIDIQNDVIATTPAGKPVYLKDIWPTHEEVQALVASAVKTSQFTNEYADVFKGSPEWQAVKAPVGELYAWDEKSTYVQEPPFFTTLTPEVKPITAITGARVLCKLGDSITTDHISPAGSIKKGTPAANFLDQNGVRFADYNQLGARRGNDRVMTRATFANIRVKNEVAPGTEGGFTVDFTGLSAPAGASVLPANCPTTGITGAPVRYIYDAVQNYKQAGTKLVVLAGVDYGMGSSRDWAAKGTFLLNVATVIAKSYERIHRANLVGMGVLPLQFEAGQDANSLGLDGSETFDIQVDDKVQPRSKVQVTATKTDGKKVVFSTLCRIDTPVEVDYYRNGGILHTVLRKMAKA